ncbi:YvrJ family protein [Geobacillus thermodenitrificans]|mgnify:CR=1 FL=1|jgi:hypothetical protein|uniref:YvrJ family protein n=1 Tax=Saccharococcus caldoxylosilyticus TaxID=81408 RepID=A0A150M3F4_9BACL|nr:YvrJ family protein [Parageobacillus caldoxylosilyticus]KYD18772.1 hypothetical protein B4119_4021 [Parageobacillus caldoxylosilyticus]
MEQIQLWTNLLGNLGFPIVITGYLLLRFEKKIEILTEAISDLKNTYSNCFYQNNKHPHNGKEIE